MKIERIKIEELRLHEHHLDIRYSADEFRFSTKIFYHDVTFSSLIERYSNPLIQRISAYIALFEGMKFCSLYPRYYDISLISQQLNENVIEGFIKVYQGVFAQHWYENNITDYPHPDLIYAQKLGNYQPLAIFGNNQTLLMGCGGGKDSILGMKILEESEIAYATIQYAHSVYGKAELQHQLIDQVIETMNPIKSHRISIYDDFTDFPFLPLYHPKNSGIISPETPMSVFECLFIMLNEGYHYLSFAHEKSANTGNFFWKTLSREVNHQWGKSLEAEQQLNQCIQANLLENFNYFSILQPIYDLRIFENLSKYPHILPKIHSCNIEKPWCKKCPKCAYVWLGLMAFFDSKDVDAVFGMNLFDDEDLQPIFREMLGLSEHTPFECIGEIAESRLMMKKCLEKGLSGKALDLFKEEILADSSIDWQVIINKYSQVYEQEHAIPAWLFAQIKRQF